MTRMNDTTNTKSILDRMRCISDEGVRVLKTLSKDKNVVAFREELMHDGFDTDGPLSYLWDLHIITCEKDQYDYYLYHWEDWFCGDPEEYTIEKKGSVRNLYNRPFYGDKIKKLSRQDFNLKKYLELLNNNFVPCYDLTNEGLSLKGEEVIDHLTQIETVIAFEENVDYEHCIDGEPTELWELHVIIFKNNHYLYDHYTWENKFYNEKKGYKLQSINYIYDVMNLDGYKDKIEKLSKVYHKFRKYLKNIKK